MLTVQNLSKRFGKKQVLNDISFNAKKGEVTALIGVNGIGKTTIMNCIAGLLPFDKQWTRQLILCARSIQTGIAKRKGIY